MKKCNDCNLKKTLDKFYKDKGNKDGRQGFCKDCGRLRVRKWYRAHSEGDHRLINVTKGGIKLGNNKNKQWRRYLAEKCRRCEFVPEDICQLTVDHIDRNKKNNVIENLQTLCANCHYLKTKIERVAPEKLLLLNLVPVPEVSGTL